MSNFITVFSLIIATLAPLLGPLPKAFGHTQPKLNADCGRLLISPFQITRSEDYTTLIEALSRASDRPLTLTERSILPLMLKGANVSLHMKRAKAPILGRDILTVNKLPRPQTPYLDHVIGELGQRLKKDRVRFYIPHPDTVATWTFLGIRAQDILNQEHLTKDSQFEDLEEALRRMEEDAMIARDEVQAPFVDEFVYLTARQMESLKLAFYLPGPSLLKNPSTSISEDLVEAEKILRKTFSPLQTKALIHRLFEPLFTSFSNEHRIAWRTLFIPPHPSILLDKPAISEPRDPPQPPPKENPRWPPLI